MMSVAMPVRDAQAGAIAARILPGIVARDIGRDIRIVGVGNNREELP